MITSVCALFKKRKPQMHCITTSNIRSYNPPLCSINRIKPNQYIWKIESMLIFSDQIIKISYRVWSFLVYSCEHVPKQQYYNQPPIFLFPVTFPFDLPHLHIILVPVFLLILRPFIHKGTNNQNYPQFKFNSERTTMKLPRPTPN